MVEELITYPDARINIISPDVRRFDDELIETIENLKDTIIANDAEGLAAIQCAIPAAVVVVKDENGEFLELVNPRIIRKSGKVNSRETSLYMPNITRVVPRYEKIRVVYEDREGNSHSLRAEGDFSYLLQRKIDYLFGGTFANKLEHKDRKGLEQELASEGAVGEFNATNSISKREYFKSFINKLLFFEFLTLFGKPLNFSPETISSFYTFDKFATVAIFLLIIAYFAYAKYEANKVISCTGCQVISFTAVSIKYFLASSALFGLCYYFVRV